MIKWSVFDVRIRNLQFASNDSYVLYLKPIFLNLYILSCMLAIFAQKVIQKTSFAMKVL